MKTIVSAAIIGLTAFTSYTVGLKEKEPVVYRLTQENQKLAEQAAQDSLARIAAETQAEKLLNHVDSVEKSIQQPLKKMVLTSSFGMRKFAGIRRFHGGEDYRAHKDSLYASFAGVVKTVKFNPSQKYSRAGKYLAIESLDGTKRLRYLHMSSTPLQEGDVVEAGDYVGNSGNTGGYIDKRTGKFTRYAPHLHLELAISKDNRWVPVPFSYMMDAKSDIKNARKVVDNNENQPPRAKDSV